MIEGWRRKSYEEHLERDRDNVQLLLQLIDLAFTNPEFSQTAVIEAFDFAIKSNISDAEKLQFSQRKLDFLEDLSYDIDIYNNGREDYKYYSDRDRGDLPHRRGSRYSDHRDVRDSYRDNFRGMRDSPGYYMSPNVHERFHEFKTGNEELTDISRSGRPTERDHKNLFSGLENEPVSSSRELAKVMLRSDSKPGAPVAKVVDNDGLYFEK
ncbi:hypothetical protein KIN20_005347 [Parelaphostrongylus tenuis]|uniref:Uncharacterized protein n=1 Tax=Parelaphostrongylus tenuis TaxID=148309 RepID=A0AAD5QK05_PARTN|nr:hypothetical protein KIN20_005347 [Parelaphostrongylus tenuis]